MENIGGTARIGTGIVCTKEDGTTGELLGGLEEGGRIGITGNDDGQGEIDFVGTGKPGGLKGDLIGRMSVIVCMSTSDTYGVFAIGEIDIGPLVDDSLICW